jgi:3-deoxy-D-manno-octulosonate 8-phosphate phosphatase KdsC-like HAD superfamily phosphatase
VADSHPEVLAEADIVLAKPGGRGAVRELAELVLKSR